MGVGSRDRSHFEPVAWIRFTVHGFAAALTLLKRGWIYISGAIPRFEVNVKIIINKILSETVSG